MESKSRRLQARNLFDPVAVVRDSRVHGAPGEIHIFPEIAERDRTPPVSTSKRINLFQK